MAYLVSALVFCPLISALAFNAPKATPCGGFHAKVAVPEPTKAPDFELELLRRQDVQLSLIEGPNNICGYQFGSLGEYQIVGIFLTCSITDQPVQPVHWKSVIHQHVDLLPPRERRERFIAMVPPHLNQDILGPLALEAPPLQAVF
jgi:hypothetical protein